MFSIAGDFSRALTRFALTVLTSAWFALGWTSHVAADDSLHARIDQLSDQAAVGPRGVTVDDLTFLRRVSLDLTGRIPSVVEAREFLADAASDKRARAIDRLMSSPDFYRHLAVVFDVMLMERRGDKHVKSVEFRAWLQDFFQQKKPYNELVHSLLSADGTDEKQRAASAFFLEREVEPNLLTREIGRMFLGIDLQCAQCHDHPFDENWKQHHFEGVAAQFGQAETGGLGVFDKPDKMFEVDDLEAINPEASEDDDIPQREVAPAVPFGKEWLPAEGTAREQFAHWMTHPENRRFERAIVNRVWGLMFGRPFIAPVDDMPNPGESEADHDVLDMIGRDFREHNYDLKRMILTIASTKPFRIQSVVELDNQSQADVSDEELLSMLDESWAIFPMTRLRPEQIIGSMLQASSIQTIDQNSHLFTRFQRFTNERDFVNEYGDLGDQELVEQTGTIPQALLRMNSNMTRGAVESGLFSACGRISNMSTTNEEVLEAAYFVCLTRKPSPEEREHFLEQLGEHTDDRRNPIVEDIFWTLFNSPEFSWNH